MSTAAYMIGFTFTASGHWGEREETGQIVVRSSTQYIVMWNGDPDNLSYETDESIQELTSGEEW